MQLLLRREVPVPPHHLSLFGMLLKLIVNYPNRPPVLDGPAGDSRVRRADGDKVGKDNTTKCQRDTTKSQRVLYRIARCVWQRIDAPSQTGAAFTCQTLRYIPFQDWSWC